MLRIKLRRNSVLSNIYVHAHNLFEYKYESKDEDVQIDFRNSIMDTSLYRRLQCYLID